MTRASALLMLLAAAGFVVACGGKPKPEEPVPQAEPVPAPAPAPAPENDAPSPPAAEFSIRGIEVGKRRLGWKSIAPPRNEIAGYPLVSGQ